MTVRGCQLRGETTHLPTCSDYVGRGYAPVGAPQDKLNPPSQPLSHASGLNLHSGGRFIRCGMFEWRRIDTFDDTHLIKLRHFRSILFPRPVSRVRFVNRFVHVYVYIRTLLGKVNEKTKKKTKELFFLIMYVYLNLEFNWIKNVWQSRLKVHFYYWQFQIYVLCIYFVTFRVYFNISFRIIFEPYHKIHVNVVCSWNSFKWFEISIKINFKK